MEDFAKKRLEICKTCPLFKKQYDGNHRCNKYLWVSPDGEHTSLLPKHGFINGCNCICEIAVNNPNKHCNRGLW